MNAHATYDLTKRQGSLALGLDLSASIASMPAPPAARPLLLTEYDSTRAIALESTTFGGEPFLPTTPFPLGSDRQTRISLFAMNVGPSFDDPTASSSTANAEDFAHHRYPL